MKQTFHPLSKLWLSKQINYLNTKSDCSIRVFYHKCAINVVIWSDKIGLIAGKYIFLFNNVYLHFCVCYNNSVSFSKISINFYTSDEKTK